MDTTSLIDTKLYKELAGRGTTQAKEYAGMLIRPSFEAEGLLQYAKEGYGSFTDHSIKHSLRILEYIADILSPQLLQAMTDADLFCFIMAALFHDAGMGLKQPDAEKGRARHHELAAEPLTTIFESMGDIRIGKEMLRQCIEHTCLAHGWTLEELESSDKLLKTSKVNGQPLHYGLLAILLRIGDLMDMDTDRSPLLVRLLRGGEWSEESLNHHDRHRNIDEYDYTPEAIDIRVKADNLRQYEIWAEWLGWLEQDILWANTNYMPRLFPGCSLPRLCREIQQGNDPSFTMEDMRFELDDKGSLWQIISQSIYTDRMDFLREVTQNAIDATLHKYYKDASVSLHTQSPRGWPVAPDDYVYIVYDDVNNQVAICDNGVGMDKSDLKSFIFCVAGSGYKEQPDHRDFPFPGISTFGVGFISCLASCKEIRIYTKKPGCPAYEVKVSTNANHALIQQIDAPTGFSGTTVLLYPKTKLASGDIAEYMQNNFPHPSVDIKISHWRRLTDSDGDILLDYITSLRCLEERRYKENNQVKQEIAAPLTQMLTLVKCMQLLSEKTIQNLDDNEKALVQQASEILDETTQLPSSEKNALRIWFSLPCEENKGLAKNARELVRARLEKLQQQYDALYFSIHIRRTRIRYDMPADGYIFLLSSDFESIEASYPLPGTLPNLKNWQGILVVYTLIEDMQLGVEGCAAVQFLFNNNVQTDRMYSFARSNGPTQRPQNRENMVISLGYEVDDEYRDEEILSYWEDPDNWEEPTRLDSEYTELRLLPDCLKVRKRNEVESLFDRQSFWVNSIENPEFNTLVQLNQSTENMLYTSVYQDGVRLSIPSQTLLPIGCCKATLNLTANARLKLNVSRHGISEAEDDLRRWIKGPGSAIQTAVLKNIKRVFDSIGIEAGNGLISPYATVSYLEQLMANNAGEIAKQIGLC